MKIKQETWLKDTLYNTSTKNARTVAQEEYGRGVLVGVVGTIQSQLGNFDDAVKFVAKFMPEKTNENCIPDVWMLDFRDALAANGKKAVERGS